MRKILILLFSLYSVASFAGYKETEVASFSDPTATTAKTECIHTKRIGPIVICDGWATYKRSLVNKAYLYSSYPDGDEPTHIAEHCLELAIAAAAYMAFYPLPDAYTITATGVFNTCVEVRFIDSMSIGTRTESQWTDWHRI